MTRGIIALLMLLGALQADAPSGNADAGKRQWQTQSGTVGPNQGAGILWCQNCHGPNAEGGFGPDLAGRGLSFAQVKQAVRQPWGVMPRYPPESVTDQALADVTAYFASLPKVAAPAPWKTPRPSAEPRGPYVMTVSGCYQCHGALMTNPRRVLGGEFGEALDFALFTKVIYNHNEYYPQNQMGLFSRDRLTEPTLQEIYQYLFKDLGIRVPVTAAVSTAATADGNTSFTITVANDGEKGKGLTAEEMTIAVAVPPEAMVLTTTGAGSQGLDRTTLTAGAPAMVWKVARLAPGEKQTYTLTVSGAQMPAALKGSLVTWNKPALGPAATSKADSVVVALPAAR